MSESQKSKFNFGVIVGLLGTIAGIYLIIQKDWVIGISGTIASAGLAYISYRGIQSS